MLHKPTLRTAFDTVLFVFMCLSEVQTCPRPTCESCHLLMCVTQDIIDEAKSVIPTIDLLLLETLASDNKPRCATTTVPLNA